MGPMGIRTSTVTTVGLGAAGWTGLEYGLHRFAMHELRGRGLASVEHLKHHADVTNRSRRLPGHRVDQAIRSSPRRLPIDAAVEQRRLDDIKIEHHRAQLARQILSDRAFPGPGVPTELDEPRTLIDDCSRRARRVPVGLGEFRAAG